MASIAALLVLIACADAPAAFSGLVLFGDSLSDVGNVYNQTFGIAPQSPPYFQGRYSNGPLWAENLALELNLPAPTPSRLNGRNYAYAGTKTGSGSTFIFPFSFPNIGSQINSYLGGNTPTADQLFVVWGGGNDFIGGQSNPSVPVNNIASHVTTLANAGARQFLVPNLPPLGKTPRFRGTADEPVMDSRSLQFNSQLASTLANLELSLDVQVWQLDVGGLFADLLSSPGAWGFTNVTEPALVGNTPAPNQDEYVFWDDIHPTRIAHGILGSIAADLLVTHRWASNQTGGSWSNPANWDPPGVPSGDWIAHVINDNLTLPQAVAVEQNSSVQQVLIRGDTNRMTLIVQSAAELRAGSITIAAQGKLDLQGGTVTAPAVHVAAGATLGGTGAINGNVLNDGTVAPGQPGTVLTISGDYTQSADAVLAIDLAGTGSGTYDRLDVSGTASLAGTVAIHLIDGFVALPGQTFTVLTFGSRSGNLSVSNQTGFSGLLLDPTFSDTSLSITATALGGDGNLDGAVNLADFNILASNFGQAMQNWLNGDFNNDGFVNLADFNILAANFGQVVTARDPSPQDWAALASVVPEPVTLIFTLAVLPLLLRRIASRRAPRSTPS